MENWVYPKHQKSKSNSLYSINIAKFQNEYYKKSNKPSINKSVFSLFQHRNRKY